MKATKDVLSTVKTPSVPNIDPKMISDATGAAAKYILKQQKISKEKKEVKEAEARQKKDAKVTHDFVQNYLLNNAVKEVTNGLVHTADNKWVKILEIMPINFYKLPIKKRNEIARKFATMFRILPANVQVKKTSDASNVSELYNNILNRETDEEHYLIKLQRKDYLNKIKFMSQQTTVANRYFLIIPYDGKSKDSAEISDDMEQLEESLNKQLAADGNYVIHKYRDSDYEANSLLYYFFNRKSVQTIPYDYRYQRILADTRRYNEATGSAKEVFDVDLFAPRGLGMHSQSYIRQDGQYITWLILKETGHPSNAYAGWLDHLSSGCSDIDVDIFIRRNPRETTLTLAEKYTSFKRVSALNNQGKQVKYEEIMKDVNNNQYVTRSMRNNNEDLYNVTIIFTIRAGSVKALKRRRNELLKTYSSMEMYVEDTFLNTEELYTMTLPIAKPDKTITGRASRNYLTSSLNSLYLFTSRALYDPTGFLIGKNPDDGTIVAINNFNTHWYKNANIAIFGTSGSGKTFTEQILGYGMFFAGIRVFYILPVKGHEYIRGCKNVNGTFISIGPGFPECINMLDIRPETKIDMSTISDDTSLLKVSLRAKKATSITTAVQLLMFSDPMTTGEANKLNTAIINVYERFGITDDNESIFNKDGSVKKMPITSDLYDELLKIPGTERITDALEVIVHGSCKNMDQQTNVDLRNNFTVLNVDEEIIGAKLLPWFLYVAFDCVYDMVKSSRTHFDAVFLDEVWKMMKNPSAAEQVQSMAKLIRGYAGCVITATQDILDFLVTEFGAAVLSNTELKLFLGLKENECDRVASIIHLSDEDQVTIKSFQRGQGLLMSNGDKVKVDITATQREIETFTTDPNILRQIAEREKMEMQQASQ